MLSIWVIILIKIMDKFKCSDQYFSTGFSFIKIFLKILDKYTNVQYIILNIIAVLHNE